MFVWTIKDAIGVFLLSAVALWWGGVLLLKLVEWAKNKCRYR
jgi:hypothetical protein